MKFRSSLGRAGSPHLRFYKGASNTGTHVGHLWTSTGALLATATFTGRDGVGLAGGGARLAGGDRRRHHLRRLVLLRRWATTRRRTGYFAPGVHQRPADRPGGRRRRRQRRLPVRGRPAFPDADLPVGATTGSTWCSRPRRRADRTRPRRPCRWPPRRGRGRRVGVLVPTASSATFSEPLTPEPRCAVRRVLLRGPARCGFRAAVRRRSRATSSYVHAPAPRLGETTSYSATVKGRERGRTDVVRQHRSSADHVWTFTTQAGPAGCRVLVQHLVDASAQPGPPRNLNDATVDRGRSGVPMSALPGYITAHPLLQGHLGHRHPRGPSVDVGGQRCWPRATFTGETASGWQQVAARLARGDPADTTYVASCYSASTGYYVATVELLHVRRSSTAR